MSRAELKQKGFTIIEVVLVLAIAALIFLMVFIALPALQRNQRDTQRRSDLSRLVSQLQQYATNNKGSMPTNANIGTFVTGYLTSGGQRFEDPSSGSTYSVTANTGAPSNPGDVYYQQGGSCNGEAVAAGTAPLNTRVAVAVMKLEGSGSICMSTQS